LTVRHLRSSDLTTGATWVVVIGDVDSPVRSCHAWRAQLFWVERAPGGSGQNREAKSESCSHGRHLTNTEFINLLGGHGGWGMLIAFMPNHELSCDFAQTAS
jgi:hypothetical protein